MPVCSALILAIVWRMPGGTGPVAGAPTRPPHAVEWRLGRPSRAQLDSISLTTPTGVLAGTLLVPEHTGKIPVALILAGSGATDRDGNAPGATNNSLRLLAEGLAANGIATLRADKRGVAGSSSAAHAESELRFDTYVDDAVAWIRRLQSDDRFSAVSVIGHSEGSLVGMLAAARTEARAFVSIGGIGRRAGPALHDQLVRNAPPDLVAPADRIIASLEAGVPVDSVPRALAPLFRASVQPYVISYFRYDPAIEIAKLKVPVLIAQGKRDLQVPPEEAARLSAAAPNARVLLIDSMNHVLKDVDSTQTDLAGQMASYTDPGIPVSPRLVAGIAAFLRERR